MKMDDHMDDHMDELRPEPGDITKLGDIGRHWAIKTPDRLALTAGERTWTYGAIDRDDTFRAGHRCALHSIDADTTDPDHHHRVAWAHIAAVGR